mmetsp:Transcript_86270/g.180501  ORF Transcript_86270/g.180501 Transcript_86270/m.180501 type:complete len:414 (+) Transcript_86270:450-1691(+)
MSPMMNGQKPGDWVCPECNDLQFARNTQCRKCGMPNPGGCGGCNMPPQRPGFGFAPTFGKPGDWTCPACGDHQFARNEVCRKCGAKPPAGGSGGMLDAPGGVPHKFGDWICPNCSDLVFARNSNCRRCGTPNPHSDNPGKGCGKGDFHHPLPHQPHGGMPGDWICTNCGDHCFASRTHCRKCSSVRPSPNDFQRGRMGQDLMTKRHLYVTGLPGGLTNDKFITVLSQYTRMKWAQVLSTSTLAPDGQPESIGLLEAENFEDVKWAFDHLNGNIAAGLEGSRPLTLKLLTTQEATDVLQKAQVKGLPKSDSKADASATTATAAAATTTTTPETNTTETKTETKPETASATAESTTAEAATAGEQVPSESTPAAEASAASDAAAPASAESTAVAEEASSFNKAPIESSTERAAPY